MPLEPDEEVLAELKRLYKRDIVSSRGAVEPAVDEYLDGHQDDPEWIKSHFGELVEDIQVRAYEIYLESEQEAAGEALKAVFRDLADETDVDEIFEVLKDQLHTLDRFFLSLTNGRRPRAGYAFEYLMRDLFEVLGYPFTANPDIGGRPDMVLPGEERYKEYPLDCIILTIKRSLRERWRQIVTEGADARGFFLATIDESVSENALNQMMEAQIHLVVPGRLTGEVEHYRDRGNVISYEYFFRHYLDPAMERWREDGLVT